MKKLLIIFIFLGIAYPSFAAITFDTNGKWETTFDCDAQVQTDSGWITCDDMQEAGGWSFRDWTLTDGVANNWTESSTPNEWYYNQSTFDTYTSSNRDIFVGDTFYKHTGSIIGSLTAEQWIKGDNDSLGYETPYVYHTTDPDLETSGKVYLSWGITEPIVGDYVSEVTVSANNPDGGGGKGFRNVDGDGGNVDTGPGRVVFPEPQKELWIRYYIRHEEGYAWYPISSGYLPLGQKHIYLRAGASAGQYAGFASDRYAIITQSTSNYTQVYGAVGTGWSKVMGIADVTQPNGADGDYHCYEIYLKMDTSLSNGVARMWIEGELIFTNTSVDWSGAVDDYHTPEDVTTNRLGWTYFDFAENNSMPRNYGPKDVDFDDIIVYNTTPPNRYNPSGLNIPYIGPIGTTPLTSTGTMNGTGNGNFR